MMEKQEGRRAEKNHILLIFAIVFWILAHAVFISQYLLKNDGYFVLGFILVDIAICLLLFYRDHHPGNIWGRVLLYAIPIESFALVLSFILGNFAFALIVDVILYLWIRHFYRKWQEVLGRVPLHEINRKETEEKKIVPSRKAIIMTVISMIIGLVPILVLVGMYLSFYGTYYFSNEEFCFHVGCVCYIIALVMAVYVAIKNPSFRWGKIWLRCLFMIALVAVEFYLLILYSCSVMDCNGTFESFFKGLSNFPD